MADIILTPDGYPEEFDPEDVPVPRRKAVTLEQLAKIAGVAEPTLRETVHELVAMLEEEARAEKRKQDSRGLELVRRLVEKEPKAMRGY